MTYKLSRSPAVAALIMLFGFFASPAVAQDSHYWTLQYGPKSSLLGGAVIGSVNDVSATYYNPGALSRAENLSFAVSTDVFEVNAVILQDGGGNGIDLGRSSSGLRPSMIAGTIVDSLFGGGVIGYSAMNRVKGSQDFSGLVARGEEDLDPELEITDLIGIIRFEGAFSDFWAGLTYSHRIGSHFGIGATGYLASRSQRRRRESLAEVLATDGTAAIDVDIAGGNYSSLRLLGKFGAFVEFGEMTAGITVTTPGMQLKGSGELGLNFATVRPDSVALAFSIQTDLPVEYRTPLSVGAGVGVPLGPVHLHVSAEWYDKVDPYVVIQGETINAIEPATLEIPVDAVHEVAEVLNWGVGAVFRVSQRFNGYLSYYQDNSGLTNEIERSSLSILPFDVQTFSVGTDFVVGPALMTLGVGYGWGEAIARTLVDIDQEGGSACMPDVSSANCPVYLFRNMRVLFGFEVGV